MDDERLLGLLGRALEPAPAEPPRARVEALRAMATRAGGRSQSHARGRRALGRRLIAAAALAVLAFLGGLVVGHDLPRPLRVIAHGLGLPVESPALADARDALDVLGLALSRDDREGVRRADAKMVRLVKALPAGDKRKIEPVAHEVHLRAVAVLEGREEQEP